MDSRKLVEESINMESVPRTEQQQRDTIERLLRLWLKYPDLRLAQLILNGFWADFYYEEDDTFIQSLEQFYQQQEGIA